MHNLNLEELHRLRANLEAAERRINDASMAVSRIMEELREAQLSLILVLEHTRTIQEFGAETHTHWVVGGPTS